MEVQIVSKKLHSHSTTLGDVLEYVAHCPEGESTQAVHDRLREAFQFFAKSKHAEYIRELEQARVSAAKLESMEDRKSVDHMIGQLLQVAETN